MPHISILFHCVRKQSVLQSFKMYWSLSSGTAIRSLLENAPWALEKTIYSLVVVRVLQSSIGYSGFIVHIFSFLIDILLFCSMHHCKWHTEVSNSCHTGCFCGHCDFSVTPPVRVVAVHMIFFHPFAFNLFVYLNLKYACYRQRIIGLYFLIQSD